MPPGKNFSEEMPGRPINSRSGEHHPGEINYFWDEK
jgi:hypothetical protein